MATGAPNAILAINSLDRYITAQFPQTSYFNALWATGFPTITYVSGSPPLKSGVLTAAGIPTGSIITAVDTSTTTLTGRWIIRENTARIFAGLPILGSSVFATGLAGVITLITAEAVGYTITLSNANTESSAPSTSVNFDATWFNGSNTVTFVSGSKPNVNDVITRTGNFTGVVTQVVGNDIEFTGVTNSTQSTPASMIRTTFNPITQITTTVTINQNTTTTQLASTPVKQVAVVAGGSQPFANYLIGEYANEPPYSNSFDLRSPGALIYGYIQRIVVSQIQVQCNIPTVCFGLNDNLYITDNATGTDYQVTIPFGYYSGEELAAYLDAKFATIAGLSALAIDVSYSPRDGFVFESKAGTPQQFYFPSLAEIRNIPGVSEADFLNALKTYRLIGITIANDEANPNTKQISTQFPNFLYTPYIDFYSDILTNYQTVKDTNTSVAKPKGLMARVYLSGNGNVQSTAPTAALGTQPFVVTADLNSPKVIKWNPDVAVPSIDFQLRDCYGDLIPGPEQVYSTEWQMTLLCIEGREWNS
jgi:hypothetical protein